MDKRSLLFVFVLTASFFLINLYFQPDPTTQAETQSLQKVSTNPISDDYEISPVVNQESSTDSLPKNFDANYYVLQNDYMQLVFSDIGGAISECNLVLERHKNDVSVVKPTELEKRLEKFSPQNLRFPVHKYYSSSTSGEKTYNSIGQMGGYYPLLRRSQINKQQEYTYRHLPKYCALNIVSSHSDIENLRYKVTNYNQNTIQFVGSYQGIKITKTFTLQGVSETAPYSFSCDVEVDGNAQNLWITSGVPEVELISGSYSPLLRYRTFTEEKERVDDLEFSKNQKVIESYTYQPDWVSNSNGFFGVILDPLSNMPLGLKAEKIPGEEIPTRLSLIDPKYNLYPANDYPGYQTYLPIKPSGQVFKFQVFAGPFDDAILDKVDTIFSQPTKGYYPNFASAKSITGWFSFISEPFSKFLFWIMSIFYMITRSWGISIILLTIVLRLMLYPLNAWSIRSTTKMQQIAPQIKALQDRYKDDPKRAQLEIMTLYREKGVNPFMGCFPMLIQMPFLFGMFYVLKSAFPLRGASFIPGWINDLSAPDVLFSWNVPIFFLGTQFHLLPIIVGLVMLWQQKFMTASPGKNNASPDQAKQQKAMGNIMTILITVIFYKFPSGMNIYFLSSTLLGILQQWYITNKTNLKSVKKFK